VEPGDASFRIGYSAQSIWQRVPMYAGIGDIRLRELDRVELRLGDAGFVHGYVRAAERLLPLPTGSHLASGVFTWQTAPGFIGSYDLVFVTEPGPTAKRVDIRMTLMTGSQ
jgi:hypothetical protein